ncbi:MAG: glycosyltransferase, partial [Candidatus Hodarchaeota archaeon]
MRQLLISVVIPVFRSGDALKELHRRLDNTFTNVDADYEFILIDDASPDNSWEIMKSLRAENKKVKIISLSRNFGQHNALMCGFHHCDGD